MLAWDDLTGMKLDAGKVKEARAKEIQYVQDKVVYNKIPRSTVIRNGWKVVQTRWIDINKGDSVNPEYRSRLVAKDFKDDNRLDLFAATPPLEALKCLISMWMTEG